MAVLTVNLPQPPEFSAVLVTPGVTQPVELHFTGTAGQSYTVYYRADLSAGSWAVLAHIPTLASNRTVNVVDGLAVGAGQRFYRIVTPMQP